MPRYTLPSPLLSCLLFLFVCLFRCHSVKLANAISQKSTCFSKYIPLNHRILIMLLGSWGLVCDNENPSPSVDPLQWPDCVTVTAWRPDWDRGVWQPACMANKLTRDPCDNEWTRHRVSAGARLCVCACMRTLGQRTDSNPSRGANGNKDATTNLLGKALLRFCFSPPEAVEHMESEGKL